MLKPSIKYQIHTFDTHKVTNFLPVALAGTAAVVFKAAEEVIDEMAEVIED